MEHYRWLPFDPYRTYIRRYNEFFWSELGREYLQGVVLDVGAGGDKSAKYEAISNSVDEYISVDISSNEGVMVRADAGRLPFRDGSVDTVVMSEVLEHLPITVLPTIVREVARVLSPSGSFLASTPFIVGVHGAQDHVRLTSQGIVQLLEDVGFNTVETFRGGGLGELILQTLYNTPRELLRYVSLRGMGWGFAPIHYFVYVLSWIFSFVPTTLPDNWYLENFVVARL